MADDDDGLPSDEEQSEVKGLTMGNSLEAGF